jgi:hypothetical protein
VCAVNAWELMGRLLSHYCYTVVTPLLNCCSNFVSLSLHCCFTHRFAHACAGGGVWARAGQDDEEFPAVRARFIPSPPPLHPLPPLLHTVPQSYAEQTSTAKPTTQHGPAAQSIPRCSGGGTFCGKQSPPERGAGRDVRLFPHIKTYFTESMVTFPFFFLFFFFLAFN